MLVALDAGQTPSPVKGAKMHDEGNPLEIWKAHPETAGAYEVSTEGRIKSLSREVVRAGRGTVTTRERILKPATTKGYLHVTLYLDGRQVNKRVHVLVLETFRGPCPLGMEGCHEDGNRANPRLGNLRWGTRESNCADKVTHGTNYEGERMWKAKLTEDDVREIRSLSASGMNGADIGRRFGITAQNVWCIVKRKTWKHVA